MSLVGTLDERLRRRSRRHSCVWIPLQTRLPRRSHPCRNLVAGDVAATSACRLDSPQWRATWRPRRQAVGIEAPLDPGLPPGIYSWCRFYVTRLFVRSSSELILPRLSQHSLPAVTGTAGHAIATPLTNRVAKHGECECVLDALSF